NSPTYIVNDMFTKDVWHHLRIDFDLTTGWQIKLDGTQYGSGYAYSFYSGSPSDINYFDMSTIYSGEGVTDYSAWIDALGYSWDSNYNIGNNLNPASSDAELEFTIDAQLVGVTSEDTLDSVELKYSYINDEGSNDLLIYNYVSEDWLTIIDDSIYSSFSEHSYAIGSDYYDQDYNLKFKFIDSSPETYHQFYLDQFRIDYSYTKTGGNINADITKTISDSFLNRYDTGFSNYKKLYDITIEFDYNFTKELPQYGDLAKFCIEANEYDLIRD
ncbi:unnamed protein product, partial [marine sediment metagenome]